jgi:hypothetical protein
LPRPARHCPPNCGRRSSCRRSSCRSSGNRQPTRHACRCGTHLRTRSCSWCGTGHRPGASCCQPGHHHRRYNSQGSGPSAPRRWASPLAPWWISPGAPACVHLHRRVHRRAGPYCDAAGHPRTCREPYRSRETLRRQARLTGAAHRPTYPSAPSAQIPRSFPRHHYGQSARLDPYHGDQHHGRWAYPARSWPTRSLRHLCLGFSRPASRHPRGHRSLPDHPPRLPASSLHDTQTSEEGRSTT